MFLPKTSHGVVPGRPGPLQEGCAGLVGLLMLGALVLTACLLAAGWISPAMAPDSGTYINASVVRSPMYVWFLAAMRGLFGEHFAEAVVLFQVTFGVGVAAYVGLRLQLLLGVSRMHGWMVFLVLFLPVLNPVHQIGLHVLSEGLAYPLFLMAACLMLDALLTGSLRAFLYSLAVSALLILVRKQFLFLWPAAFFALLGYCMLWRRGWRVFVMLCGALLLASSLASLTERGWNYYRHGFWGGIPFTGMQLVAMPLFVSPLPVAPPPEGGAVAEFLSAASAALSAQELTWSSIPVERRRDMYGEFFYSYNPSIFRVIWPLAERILAPDRSDEVAVALAVDRGLVDAALHLIKAEPLAYLKMYLTNVATGLAGGLREGAFYLLLQLGLGGLALLALFRQRVEASPMGVAVLWALLLHLGNVTAVAIVEPAMARYTFYTHAWLVTILFLVIAPVVSRRSH